MIIYLHFFVAGLLFGGSVFAQNSNRPNILFILADDMGYNDIGYHARRQGSEIRTPFLDQLASQGIKLDNYYVQPLCTPTRSQLMSGRYQIHTGLQHRNIAPSQPNALPLNNKILPEQLRNCGYDTHMVGKWHLGFHHQKYLPWKRGFKSYFGCLFEGQDYYTYERCYDGMCGIDMRSSKDGPFNNTKREYSTHLFTRKTIEAIEDRDREKPFFMYLSYHSVHSPSQAPESYVNQFSHIADKRRRIYAGMALAMDESVKNITNFLSDTGLLENTIIVFSSDNGGAILQGANNWPLRGSKGSMYEGGIKAVGFIYGHHLGQQSQTGIYYRGLMHVSDWFPTLLAAVGCGKMNGTLPIDGFNQWDSIRKRKPPPRKEILFNIDPKRIVYGLRKAIAIRNGFDIRIRAGIRTGNWKLLTGDAGRSWRVRPPESTWTGGLSSSRLPRRLVQLFNIRNDPYEERNVARLWPKVVKRLLMRLRRYNLSAVPVLYPRKDPRANPLFHGGYWGPWRAKNVLRSRG